MKLKESWEDNRIRIGPTEESILKEITSSISSSLDNTGIFNRVFSRIKTIPSILRKIEAKEEEYERTGKKIQDIFGIRVTVYFSDDEDVVVELVKSLFQEIPEAHSIDETDGERFGPQRRNLVFRIEERLSDQSSLFDNRFIDSTFEVQFRTIFSEGWHEVEHDLRYKCKEDWLSDVILNRTLNGQLASLETISWAMLKIFDELAYTKYRKKEWASFFRNVLRIRFEDQNFSSDILELLNNENDLGKEIIKTDRKTLLEPLIVKPRTIPLKMDNVFFILNRVLLKRPEIELLESSVIKDILSSVYNR